MPIYEFSCQACGSDFEIVRSRTGFDAKKVKCAKCGGQNLRRRFDRMSGAKKKR